MAIYDLSVLNDKEFEILVADLLSAEFGTRIERFRPGKDRGVDGRWFSNEKSEVVIQCKHWTRTPLSRLISHLSSVERLKVETLSPSRYIFVCSHELSRVNKDSINEAMGSCFKSVSDIYGLEDLQDLLERHPDVERRHFKLWLTSSAVLVNLLNNDVLGRSDDALREIKTSQASYVDTEESIRARERLAQKRVLIIKGEPGVGKTTLAQQLVLESVGDGHKLVVVERDVSEVESVLDSESKQVFYFDDFLGRNFLEALDDNKDSHIIHFIRRIVLNKNKRFILTSRTHILDRGKQISELFRIDNLEKNEFELAVGKLSRFEKGKILYSHIWKSGMPAWAIEEIYRGKKYLQVLDHRNYNPRIISFITSAERLVDIGPSEFWSYVVNTLEFPEAIWRHVFERQIGEDSRDIAILVAYNGGHIEQDELEGAFIRLNGRAGNNPVQIRQRFLSGLKLAVGSVVNRVIDKEGSARCSLFNPSISDYLLKDDGIKGNAVALVVALRTLRALRYVSALKNANIISQGKFRSCLASLCVGMSQDHSFRGDVAVLLSSLLLAVGPSEEEYKFCVHVGNSIDVNDIRYSSGREMGVFTDVLCNGHMERAFEKYRVLTDHLDEIASDPSQVTHVKRCAEYLDAEDGAGRINDLRDIVYSSWLERASEIVSEASVLDGYYDPSELDGAQASVEDFFSSQFDDFGFPLDSFERSEFVEAINYEDVFNENAQAAANSAYEESPLRELDSSESLIVDYFDRGDAEPT